MNVLRRKSDFTRKARRSSERLHSRVALGRQDQCPVRTVEDRYAFAISSFGSNQDDQRILERITEKFVAVSDIMSVQDEHGHEISGKATYLHFAIAALRLAVKFERAEDGNE